MKLEKIFLKIIAVLFLSINIAYATEPPEKWYFYKVSKNTVLGGEPTFERERLIYRYWQTKLTITDKEVVIDKACTIPEGATNEIVTPLSYWKSPELVDKYQKIFSEEKILLENQIQIIKNDLNDKGSPCSKQDFTALIKTGNFMVFMTEPGYIIIFSKNLEKDRLSSATYRGLNQPLNLLGHPMLSDKKNVNKMNKECDYPDDGYYEYDSYNKCPLTELGIYFASVINKLDAEKEYSFEKNKDKFYFTKNQIKEFEYEIYLNIEKNNKLIDRLPIYKENILESAAFAQYYYIDNELKNVWLLNMVESDISQRVEKWRHYKIDNTGHFKLLESISCEHRNRKGIVKCHNG